MGETANDPYLAHRELHTSFHEILNRLLTDFYESSSGGFGNASDKFAEFKACLYLHIRWEEETLFPMPEINIKDDTVTSWFRSQHLQIKELVNLIEKDLKDGGARTADDFDYEKELVDLLATHGKMEEELLYPLIDKHVGKDELNRALVELNGIRNAFV